MRIRWSWSTSIIVAVASLTVAAACRAPDDPAARAHDVERRILAPCCRRQTLEDHDSEVARALRTEVEHRIDTGEQPAAVEDDLARRYGEDIRAMPRGADPRALLGAAVGVVLGLGALSILWFMRRRATAIVPATPPAGTDVDPEYQDRIDDELLALD